MLPVLVKDFTELGAERLRQEYFETYGEQPKIEEVSVWRKLLSMLLKVGSSHPIIMEYPVFYSERIDAIFVDKQRALIVEAKGWKNVTRLDEDFVNADGTIRQDPCYQLTNYVNKLNYFHSSGITFDGILFLYNTSDYISEECKVARNVEELKKEVDALPLGTEEDARRIIEGRFEIKNSLLDLLKELKGEALNRASQVLLGRGYGLSEEQSLLIKRVLESLENGESKTYLVKGGSGSGKSLLAVAIFLEGLSKGFLSILSYKNNRLLNAVRQALKVRLNERGMSFYLSDLVLY